MKRVIGIFGIVILLLLLLTVIVSGERVEIDNKKPGQVVEQAGTVEKASTPAGKQIQATSQSSAWDSGASNDDPATLMQEDMDQPQMVAPTTVESAMEPELYEIPWQSINIGGGEMTSTNYQMNSSTGQSFVGYASSGNYSMGTGYWYGTQDLIWVGFCGTIFGDINCDEQLNPVDVVYMVNYVYKNQDARCYPVGWSCSADVGDVDCSGGVNPVDVVYFVNYVYKNQNAFCTP